MDNKQILIISVIIIILIIIVVVIFLVINYNKKKKSPPPSPISPPSSPSPVSPPSGPSMKPEYIGCYSDDSINPGKRDLPNFYPKAHSLEECNAEAKAHGFKYFGLQYFSDPSDPNSKQCFAGDSYGKYGLSEKSCILTTNGIYEGGANQNAVYKAV